MTRPSPSLPWLRATIALALLLASPAPAQSPLLPSASDLLQRYSAAVPAQETGYLRMTIRNRVAGMETRSEMFQAPDGRRLVRTEIAGFGTMEVGRDAVGFWMRDPVGGARVLASGEGEALIPNLLPPVPTDAGALLSSETLGIERVGDRSCISIRIVLQADGHPEADLCIEEATGQLLRTAVRSPQFPGEVVSYFEDYRPYRNAARPGRIRARLPDGSEMITEILEMSDEPFDHSVFRRPEELR